MEIRVFDVGHGFFSHILTDEGRNILVDCGDNSETGFTPSDYLTRRGCGVVDRLIVSNYDDDHLRGLPSLITSGIAINNLTRNFLITPEQLRELKLEGGELTQGMQGLLHMMTTMSYGTRDPNETPSLRLEVFANPYPHFTDTNNLSVVAFLHCGAVHMAFTGDMERAGWLALLQDPTQNQRFVQQLSTVNVFVASHHGRVNGFCEEVFEHCHPAIIIVSDSNIQYETQEFDYAPYASGISWPDGSTRYVLTTRTDGVITIQQAVGSMNASIFAQSLSIHFERGDLLLKQWDLFSNRGFICAPVKLFTYSSILKGIDVRMWPSANAYLIKRPIKDRPILLSHFIM